MQHINLDEDGNGVAVYLPSGESVEVQFDGVDPIVTLVSLSGIYRTPLFPRAE